MIHDSDLVDQLVTLIGSRQWAEAQVSSVTRVWSPAIELDEIRPGAIAVQLWPDQQSHSRRARSGPWSLQVEVGVVFWAKLTSATRAEVDGLMRAFDTLLVSNETGLGGQLFDVVDVMSSRFGLLETVTFTREGQMTWVIRPNRERLQRLTPEGETDRYSGLLQAQALLTYHRA
jgi:hypothetical protein